MELQESSKYQTDSARILDGRGGTGEAMNTPVSKEVVTLCLLYFPSAAPNFSRSFWEDQNLCQVRLPLPRLITVLSINIGSREWENSLRGQYVRLSVYSPPPWECPLLSSGLHSSNERWVTWQTHLRRRLPLDAPPLYNRGWRWPHPNLPVWPDRVRGSPAWITCAWLFQISLHRKKRTCTGSKSMPSLQSRELFHRVLDWDLDPIYTHLRRLQGDGVSCCCHLQFPKCAPRLQCETC